MLKSRLKEMLHKRDMTLAELNRKTGIRPTTLSQIKAGTFKMISPRVICLLCEALSCQPGDLFEYIPDRPAEHKSASE